MTAYESAMKARAEREYALARARLQYQQQRQAVEAYKRSTGRTEAPGLSLWSAYGSVGLRSI